MKKKLLQEIKDICIYEYFYVLGLGYNVRQLKSYLSQLKSI